MNIILWVLFGTLVGVVANSTDPSSNARDITRSVFLGVIGALLGGLAANIIFGVTLSYFNFTTFLIAIAGSLILLFFSKAAKKVKKIKA